jgi:hypothetical protein
MRRAFRSVGREGVRFGHFTALLGALRRADLSSRAVSISRPLRHCAHQPDATGLALTRCRRKLFHPTALSHVWESPSYHSTAGFSHFIGKCGARATNAGKRCGRLSPQRYLVPKRPRFSGAGPLHLCRGTSVNCAIPTPPPRGHETSPKTADRPRRHSKRLGDRVLKRTGDEYPGIDATRPCEGREGADGVVMPSEGRPTPPMQGARPIGCAALALAKFHTAHKYGMLAPVLATRAGRGRPLCIPYLRAVTAMVFEKREAASLVPRACQDGRTRRCRCGATRLGIVLHRIAGNGVRTIIVTFTAARTRTRRARPGRSPPTRRAESP